MDLGWEEWPVDEDTGEAMNPVDSICPDGEILWPTNPDTGLEFGIDPETGEVYDNTDAAAAEPEEVIKVDEETGEEYILGEEEEWEYTDV